MSDQKLNTLQDLRIYQVWQGIVRYGTCRLGGVAWYGTGRLGGVAWYGTGRLGGVTCYGTKTNPCPSE